MLIYKENEQTFVKTDLVLIFGLVHFNVSILDKFSTLRSKAFYQFEYLVLRARLSFCLWTPNHFFFLDDDPTTGEKFSLLR